MKRLIIVFMIAVLASCSPALTAKRAEKKGNAKQLIARKQEIRTFSLLAIVGFALTLHFYSPEPEN